MGESSPKIVIVDESPIRAAILEEDSAVADLSYVNRQSAQTVNGSLNWSTSIQGVTPSYVDILNWQIASGRSFSDDDDASAAKTFRVRRSVDPVGLDEAPLAARSPVAIEVRVCVLSVFLLMLAPGGVIEINSGKVIRDQHLGGYRNDL